MGRFADPLMPNRPFGQWDYRTADGASGLVIGRTDQTRDQIKKTLTDIIASGQDAGQLQELARDPVRGAPIRQIMVDQILARGGGSLPKPIANPQDWWSGGIGPETKMGDEGGYTSVKDYFGKQAPTPEERMNLPSQEGDFPFHMSDQEKANQRGYEDTLAQASASWPMREGVDKEGRKLHSKYIFGRGQKAPTMADLEGLTVSSGGAWDPQTDQPGWKPGAWPKYRAPWTGDWTEPAESYKTQFKGPPQAKRNTADELDPEGGGIYSGAMTGPRGLPDYRQSGFEGPKGDFSPGDVMPTENVTIANHEVGHHVDAVTELSRVLAYSVGQDKDLQRGFAEASQMYRPSVMRWESKGPDEHRSSWPEIVADNIALYMRNGDQYDRLFPRQAKLLRKYINEDPSFSKVMTLSQASQIKQSLLDQIG